MKITTHIALGTVLTAASCTSTTPQSSSERTFETMPAAVEAAYKGENLRFYSPPIAISPQAWREFERDAFENGVPTEHLNEYFDEFSGHTRNCIYNNAGSAEFLFAPEDKDAHEAEHEIKVVGKVTSLAIADLKGAKELGFDLMKVFGERAADRESKFTLLSIELGLVRDGRRFESATGHGVGHLVVSESVQSSVGLPGKKSPTIQALPSTNDGEQGGEIGQGEQRQDLDRSFALAGPTNKAMASAVKKAWGELWRAHANRLKK